MATETIQRMVPVVCLKCGRWIRDLPAPNSDTEKLHGLCKDHEPDVQGLFGEVRR